MTRQHIRFSALRSIFWGTLLLFLDFDLNFRFGFSFTLPLLPNCIGFWLVARGTRSLAADRPSLGLLGPFWLAWALVPSAVFPRPLPSYPRRALPSGRSGPDVRRLSAVHRSGLDHDVFSSGQPHRGPDTGAGHGSGMLKKEKGREGRPAGAGLSRLPQGGGLVAGP